jgi:hypothetical protein
MAGKPMSNSLDRMLAHLKIPAEPVAPTPAAKASAPSTPKPRSAYLVPKLTLRPPAMGVGKKMIRRDAQGRMISVEEQQPAPMPTLTLDRWGTTIAMDPVFAAKLGGHYWIRVALAGTYGKNFHDLATGDISPTLPVFPYPPEFKSGEYTFECAPGQANYITFVEAEK